MSVAPVCIKVWVCDECGYWRKEQSTGVHAATDPANPNGRMVSHTLREERYIVKAAAEAARPRKRTRGRVT